LNRREQKSTAIALTHLHGGCFIIAGSFVLRYTKNMSKKKRLIIGIIAFVIIAGGIGAAFTTGRLYVGIKQPNEQILKQQIICNQTIVNKFNTMKSSDKFNDTAKAIASVKDEVIKRAGYENDPTCMYIKLYSEVMELKKDEAKKTYLKLEELIGKGQFINSNLQGMVDMSSLKSVINSNETEKAHLYGEG
jgi:hypothetical protein